MGEVRPQEIDLAHPTYGGGLVGFTGHWLTINAGYATTTTLPPINYRIEQVGCSGMAKDGSPGKERSWDNWSISHGFKSRHPGGANFLFADGSVRFLGEDINYATYQYLGSREDGQAIGKTDFE